MQVRVLQPFFSDFSPSEFWRLFIDANRQQVGPLGFDQKEPGYLKSLQSAFDFALKRIDQPLTADFLIQLHDQSVKYTKTTYHGTLEEKSEPVEIRQNFDMGLRNHGTEFGIIPTGENKNITEAGLAEILNRIANGERFVLMIASGDNAKGYYIKNTNIPKPVTPQYIDEIYTRLTSEPNVEATLSVPNESVNELKAKMTRHINNYNTAIANAADEDQKIFAIAELVHNLEDDHSFTDANCRTFVLELLPILLMKEGFPPSILTNPNRFDLYSVTELVEEVRAGFQRFNQLKATPPQPTLGHENDQLLYIDNTTATLLAFAATKDLPHWKEINIQEQQTAIEIIIKSLTEGFAKKSLTFQEVNDVVKLIRNTVQTSIYQKVSTISFFSKTPSGYGIYFDSIFNKVFGHTAFGYELLNHNLNNIAPPPPAAAPTIAKP